MDGWRLPGVPFSVPGVQRLLRAALFPAREAVSAAVRAPSLPPRLLSPSLRASVCASAPPSPAALAASPRLRPRRTHGERGPAQRWLPGGRRAWAEPGAEAGGGGRGRGAGARVSPPGRGDAAAERQREAEMLGGGEECGDGGGGGDSARGAELETEVTEAGLWKAGLGIQRAGRGRSVPPTPDAQPAFSAPTYPRERPAGDILTPTPPSPPRGERSFTTTHRYTKTPSSAKDGHTRLNSYADACCPHLNLAVLYL